MKPDYQIKKVKLYNVDCMEFMRNIPDNYYELSICDPPYGIGYDKEQNKQAENQRISNGGKWKKYKQTDWDSNIPTKEYFDELMRISKNQIIWGGNYFNLNLKGVIIWNKGKNGTMKEGELAITNINTFKIFNLTRVDAYINNDDKKIHPTQKPTELYSWILENYAKCKKCGGLGYIDVPTIKMDCDVSTCPVCKGETPKIFDSHGGSFSSACACLDMGFEFDGCEIDKEYFDNAVNRLKNNVQEYLEFR